MTYLTLSDDQARFINAATTPIVLVDPAGRELGRIAPTHANILGPDATEEEVVAEINRRIATHDGSFRLFSDLVKELNERTAG
jgi:hypothetical protein